MKNLSWGRLALGLVITLSAISVGAAVASQDPTVPRAADEVKAARELSSAKDEKLFVPDGRYVGGQGVVEPRDRETNVAGAVSGRIASVMVTEGARVKRGDVLVQLDVDVERAAVEIASAELSREEADRARVRGGQRWEERVAAEEDAKAAAARAQQSAGVLERVRRAHAGGAATGDELDRAEKAAVGDAATAAAAEARKKAVIAGSRAEDLSAAEARVLASKARLEEAKSRLAQRAIVAPADGEVLAVRVREGEFYQPSGEAAVILGDTSVLRVRVDIDERDLDRVRSGARVVVRVAARPGVDFDARVVELGRRMGRKNVRSDDPVERNDAKILEVVAELASPQGLVVGQRVTAFVEVAE